MTRTPNGSDPESGSDMEFSEADLDAVSGADDFGGWGPSVVMQVPPPPQPSKYPQD